MENFVNGEVIGGLVRHILTFGGGYFVSRGLVDADTMTTVVSALATLFGAGWSIYNKVTEKPASK